MSAILKSRVARLEAQAPEVEFSIEGLSTICKRLGFVDLEDSPSNSPELRETKRQLKKLLARLTEV